MSWLTNIAPGLVARYWRNRHLAEMQKRLYQGAEINNQYPRRGDGRSANSVMEHARSRLAWWGRYLDENSDLAVGTLNTLVDGVLGGKGIEVQPLAKGRDGQLVTELNEQIADQWQEWTRKPEVTQEMDFAEMQRLSCRTWLRDGECFAQDIMGNVRYDFPTRTPYALELIETDLVPWELSVVKRGRAATVHGVDINTWGKPTHYHFYLAHPGDQRIGTTSLALNRKTKRVPAERIIHLKFVRRIGQVRGISVFHASIRRLQDTHDYEQSERISARIAATMAAYIEKPMSFPEAQTAPTSDEKDRSIEFQDGMIYTDLLPGEKVGTLKSERPSNLLSDFRSAMLRAVSSSTGAAYSTMSRDYTQGSYSSQRQEMVESQRAYDRLRSIFVEKMPRRNYETWLTLSILAGVIDVRQANPESIFDAHYTAPALPWIDPQKEIAADVMAIRNGLKSRRQVIRERGGFPEQVDKERERDDFTPQGDEQQPLQVQVN